MGVNAASRKVWVNKMLLLCFAQKIARKNIKAVRAHLKVRPYDSYPRQSREGELLVS